MEVEIKCKCGATLAIQEEKVFEKITCPYCGNSYLLNELDSNLYSLYYQKRRNEFSVSNQTLQKYGGAGGKVYIPADVVSISDRAFLRNSYVESVVCSDKLKHIGVMAFSGCFGLKEITFNDGLEDIGSNAFNSCTGLRKVKIPSSVSLINEEAFMDCKSIVELTFDNGCKAVIGKSAFEGAERLEEVEFLSGMSVESHAFFGCDSLEKVVLSGEVKLKDNAFKGAKNLTVYITEKKGLLMPKWFNQKAFNSNVKIIWNYKK